MVNTTDKEYKQFKADIDELSKMKIDPDTATDAEWEAYIAANNKALASTDELCKAFDAVHEEMKGNIK